MPKALRAVFLLQQIKLDFLAKIVDTFKRRTALSTERKRENEILMMQKIEETEPTEPTEKVKASQADSERME